MKKLLFTLLFSFFFIKIAIAQNCAIPGQPGFFWGLSYETNNDPVNCITGSAIYFFGFVSNSPFSLNFIIEDITLNSSTSYPITGVYDDLDQLYTAELVETLINGHLYKFYLEYSESGYYCKRFVDNYGVSECSDIDEDNDGFAADIDCNDNNANDVPFGDEYCDGYDNNCNGLIDDADPDIGIRPLWFLDEDNDGFPLEGSQILACSQPAENYFIYDINNPTLDCDDTDPAINPNNTWYLDLDGDGFAAFSINSCESPGEGYTRNVLPISDCDDSDPNTYPSAVECSDFKDNDCDGSIDEIEDLVFYLADTDNDGYGDIDNVIFCTPTEGYITIYANNPNNQYDCDDTNESINPGATEIPDNGIDDDCNPETPDVTSDTDNDGDGQTENEGDCDDTNPNIYAGNTETPYNGIDDDCNPATPDDDLDGDGFTLVDDCDDTNPNVNPSVAEMLDNGIDDDCNPATSDSSLDIDNDGDGQTENEGDCDDTNANIYAGNTETPYNGIDDDCNTVTLDDDLDGDGYLLAEDCDDNNALVNPGTTEIQDNGIDDDCNPATSDSSLDVDNDGDGQTENEGDCDDSNANIYSGNTETPYNGIDDDCNPATLDDDLDGDGYLLVEDCDDNNALVNPGTTEILDNGIDDDCNPATPDSNECTENSSQFISNPLTHSGIGSNSTFLILPTNSSDISFNISGINQVSNGKPTNRYNEQVDVYYEDEFDIERRYNSYLGSNTNFEIVNISGIVKSLRVELRDGEDGNSGSSIMSISLSPVVYCFSGTPCEFDSDNDGVCDQFDVCPGFDDSVDSDGDGKPDGCDSCPYAATGDSDGDGVCDDLDICNGFDDTIDTDSDGTPDGCDICPNDSTDLCANNPCGPGWYLICHTRNNGVQVEICVNENQYQMHMDYGDTDGPCTNSNLNRSNHADKKVILYPNPVSDILTVEVENAEITNAKITIYNSYGIKVLDNIIMNTNKLSIDISRYIKNEGVYYLIIDTNSYRLSERFIVFKN